MAGYFRNVDRYGSETNNNSALDFNPVPIGYTPSASGNTANLNSFVIDPNGDMYFIDSNGDSFYINTSNPLDVLSGVQPTPTGSGNTTNLNSVFKDANGDTWIVDWKGDAIKATSAPVPETVTTITDTVTTGHLIGSYTNEAGITVDLNETVTSLKTFSIAGNTITLEYVDEAGTTTTKTVDVPADVVTTLTNALLTGNKIGTYTNESGAVVDLYETVTSVSDFSIAGSVITLKYVDEAGTENTKTLTLPAAVAETVTTLTNALVSGNKIGTYTSENGTVTDINETVTSLKTFSITGNVITIEYVDEAGVTATKTVTVPSDVITTITNSLTTGNKIGTYTNESGALVDLYETITSVTEFDYDAVSGTLMLTYKDEAGVDNSLQTNIPVQVVTTLTNAITGHKIGTYTNESGTAVDINETITTLQTFSITGDVITLEYVAEDGLTTTKTVTVPSDVVTTIANTITGHKIADYTNESGTNVVINETITSIGTITYDSVTGVLTIPYTDETGVVNSKTVTIPVGSSGAPVTVGTNPPTGTSIEGAIHLVTDDGTPTGTVLEQYIYDTESGTWIEMQRNAQDTLKFGTASPTSPGEWDGEEYFVTSTGTSAGTVTEQWIWDKQSTTWILRPSGGGSSTTANWTDVTTDPTATGNTGTLPRFVSNTVNGSKWYIDATGVAKLIEGVSTACAVVYFNSTDPSTATIFDTANPPVTNNDALKNLDCATYVSGVDGSIWTSNGTTYQTKIYSDPLHRRTVITATAGQTVFTLPYVPIAWGAKAIVTRNGIDISDAWSWAGTIGTYVPAANGGKTMDAGDIIRFHYESY